MKDITWMEALNRQAMKDEWYQQCLHDVQEREPAFNALRDTLTDRQQEIPTAYAPLPSRLSPCHLPQRGRHGCAINPNLYTALGR